MHLISSRKLLSAAAILACIGNSQFVFAADAADTAAISAPAATADTGADAAYNYSAGRMLGFVAEAQVALVSGRQEEALSDVNAAIVELDSLKNARGGLEMKGLPFGRVSYGKNGNYYIPVADDAYAVRTYARGPFWSGNKAMAVRNVQVINVNVGINPEETMQHLQTAQGDITTNKPGLAVLELKNAFDDSIHETSTSNPPLPRLLDNIYLTRILIRQENYAGARFTLRYAKSALKDYEKTVTDADRRANAEKLRGDIDTLDETIKERNPSMMRKMAQTVDQWWHDLKSWTQNKVS